MYNPFVFREPEEKRSFVLEPAEKNIKPVRDYIIGRDLSENEKYIKERFSIPKNNDIVFRKIMIAGGRKAFIIYIEGMVSTDFVNSHVINPLQLLPAVSNHDFKLKKEEIMERFISHGAAMAVSDINQVIEDINFGGCGVFVDGIDIAFSLDVRSWGHRGIDKPENEQSVYGPQEAFNEMLRNNSALIRKIIKTEKLICEGIKIGNESKTRGVIMYINDIANEGLVNEIKERIDGLNIDYIFSIEEVGELIRDTGFSVTNQIMSTERPDRAARFLENQKYRKYLTCFPDKRI